MKIIYKEDPKEWRKSALLAALGAGDFKFVSVLAAASANKLLACRGSAGHRCGNRRRALAVLVPRLASPFIVARFSFEPIRWTLRVAAFLYFHHHSTWMFIVPGRQEFIATQTLARCPNLLAFVQRQRPDGSSFLTNQPFENCAIQSNTCKKRPELRSSGRLSYSPATLQQLSVKEPEV
jgi:hypothetical protein